jgi:hypothetical protein
MLQADSALAASLAGEDWRLEEPGLIAEYREDRKALSAALTRLLRSPDGASGSGTVLRLTKVGRLWEARALLAEMEKSDPQDGVQVTQGYIKLAEGDVLGSIPDLRAGAIGHGNRHSNAFIQVCDRLAAALEGIGQTDEAVHTLADCETQLATWSDWEFVHPRNSVARSHLAALYRQTGQVEKAEAIEDALRGQLKLADLDHPIVRALKQLPSRNYQAAVRN